MKLFIFTCVSSIFIFLNHSNAQWEELGPINGLPKIGSTSYFGITIDGKNIVAVVLNKIYISTDNGDNWELTNYKPGSLPEICGVKDSNIFVSVDNDYHVSHDLGKTWKEFSDKDHKVANAILFNGDVGIMGGCCSLNKTTDFGETFKRVLGNGWSNDGYGPLLLKDGIFFAYKAIGYDRYRSTDNGETWDIISQIPKNASYGFWVTISNLIIAFDGGEYGNEKPTSAIFSTDNGITWIVKQNYSKMPTGKFQDLISCGYNLYAIRDDTKGVFISRDSGQTWTPFNKGLRLGGDYQGVQLAHDDKYLYAAYLGNGGGGGLYRAKMKDCEIDFSSAVAEVPHSYFESISPNPASDFIEISVGTRRAVSEQIDIRIYDVYGQIVNLTPTLSTNGEVVRIDVSSLAPGMYFVRIGDKVSKFIKL